jgi:hypothetical protein
MKVLLGEKLLLIGLGLSGIPFLLISIGDCISAMPPVP